MFNINTAIAKDVIYRLETCQYRTGLGTSKEHVCGATTWCEMRPSSKGPTPQCRACKIERFYVEVLLPPFGYALMDWFRLCLRDLYGTVLPENGRRQYRHAYISVAKKNAKTFYTGGLPIYHMLCEDEEKPQIFGCAAAKDQGYLVFDAAKDYILKNPDMKYRFKVLESTKRILQRDGAGYRGSYIVIAADGDVQDGKFPSLLIRDEMHRWQSAAASVLFDVMTKGQLGRREPLDIAITTAGAEYESPLWFREYNYCKQVLSGAVVDPRQYVKIWEPDLKRLEKDPQYWKTREARVAANPSHEDLGGFLPDADIESEMKKAEIQPSERSKYKRYNLNCPMVQEADPVIDMAAWLDCGSGREQGEIVPVGRQVNLREWPEYDIELLIKKWNLADKPCWMGIDASWTTDMTAAVCVFPPFEEDAAGPGCEQWTFMPFFWLPEEQIPFLERICRVPLADWVKRGFVQTTPGKAIDQREVKKRIEWARQMFNLQEVPYDRLNFRSEALSLVDDGFTCPEVQQTFLGLSQGTKFLLAGYVTGNVRHGNHPVLNWHASCLQLQYDHKDNVQPSKPERNKSSKRIDGMQAIITGLSRAIIVPVRGPDVVEVW